MRGRAKAGPPAQADGVRTLQGPLSAPPSRALKNRPPHRRYAPLKGNVTACFPVPTLQRGPSTLSLVKDPSMDPHSMGRECVLPFSFRDAPPDQRGNVHAKLYDALFVFPMGPSVKNYKRMLSLGMLGIIHHAGRAVLGKSSAAKSVRLSITPAPPYSACPPPCKHGSGRYAGSISMLMRPRQVFEILITSTVIGREMPDAKIGVQPLHDICSSLREVPRGYRPCLPSRTLPLRFLRCGCQPCSI